MSIARVAVVGSGTMAVGIAQVLAQAGVPVTMATRRRESGERALAYLQRTLQRAVERGRISDDDRAIALSLIEITTNFDDIREVDCVIEAIVEDLALKRELFERLDELAPAHAILASNTSAISITQLAAATRRPANVVGMHFFNPVPAMQLVEVVRGLATSDATIAAAIGLVQRLGKTAAEVNDYPGFVSNRILMPMINEAAFCLMEGVATRENIDAVMQLGMNHPMGPLALADMLGIDVCLEILESLQRDLGDPKYRPCPLLRRMVHAGKVGRRSGEGFYDYRNQA